MFHVKHYICDNIRWQTAKNNTEMANNMILKKDMFHVKHVSFMLKYVDNYTLIHILIHKIVDKYVGSTFLLWIT